MLPLIKEYSPKESKDIIAQDGAISQINSFIKNYSKQKKKALLLHGPTGTGKTSSVYAVANDHNLEVFELNASDFRNKQQIHDKLGSAIKQRSLFSEGKIILVDDIDGLSGTKDRGAIPEIIKLMKESIFPIIMTALNPYHQKFSSLRSKTTLVAFEPISVKDLVDHLKSITKNESLNISQEVIKTIARRSGGDLRAAINDLEILSSLDIVSKEALEELGMREKEDTIINALLKIFKTTDPKLAINAFDYVNEDIDQQILWLDENLPKEYTNPEDLARAYKHLSKANIFQRRIRRWQHWRFLVYINGLITAGVATSKDKKYDKFTQYKPTGRILKLWWAKQKSLKKKAIAEKIGTKTHTSKREILKSFPYFQTMLKNKTLGKQLALELDLDKDEVAWIKK